MYNTLLPYHLSKIKTAVSVVLKVIVCLFSISNIFAQTNPHGPNLTLDCAKCHSPESWTFNKVNTTFRHDSTNFPLTGLHTTVDCRSCHDNLDFKQVKNDCASCHNDMHFNTVGNDCARCHTADNWLVSSLSITELHERIAFPLIGVHATAGCNECHTSESQLRFQPIGAQCIDCHRQDFVNAKNPDHVKNGFSENCNDCHDIFNSGWVSTNVDHSFFPLELGHDIKDCKSCHLTDDFSQISPDCFSCHKSDFLGTTNPNHSAANFNNDCASCHTLNPGWSPARIDVHDAQYFPIYSGAHKEVWDDCTACHTNQNNYAQFTCINCHLNPETDNVHGGVSGYVYNDNACFSCHPTGDADNIFNHDATNFPLTGAHKTQECLACHSAGFEGTPTNCVDCHLKDFNASTNPNHNQLVLSQDCISCHATEAGWSPARFDVHNDFYVIEGAHTAIANDCASCHNGNYNNTPNTCVACHQQDYDATLDPNHKLAQFPKDCASCHNQGAWNPASFDHDANHFPIYSGKHNGVWTECIDCHTNAANYAIVSCINCHTNPETDDQHNGVDGYVHNDNACLACHPTGDADVVFNHDATAFPLTGAHKMANCLECHSSGFVNTPTDCYACHNTDFAASSNPNHSALGISTACISCHTTEPGWSPATFDVHNNYYALNGAHAVISNNCIECHNGNYNNTPNTCVACHQSDYDATVNPNHKGANFSTDCIICHGESNWTPATFDHDNTFFPIYSGKHLGVWNDCNQCHTNPNNISDFTCITCHINPETDEAHVSVNGYSYNSPACLACHPTGDADNVFNHNNTGFPLTGAHTTADCIQCHANGYQGTPTDCNACHNVDFMASLNPNHNALGLPTDCATCHTTDPGWAPASFVIHNDFYALNGAHATIANNCVQCHNGDYNNTPNTCIGCHNSDYTSTTTPNHISANFGTDCASCHSENAWIPSTFDHDGQNFPIYSGSHNGVWTNCNECHTNPGSYAVFTCTTCHVNPETNEEHAGVNGYVYNSPACLACHPNGEADGNSFNHNTTSFPLTGAHIGADCVQCHANGYQNTPTDCNACHNADYIASIDPNHMAANIPADCAMCHTTNPGWSPATFPIHDNFYPLTGAHSTIANNCIECHANGYSNTPNDCNGCHNTDYMASLNPNHNAIGLSTDCASCHTTNPGWNPASFDIHNTFYPLNGAHAGIASNCVQCHNGDYNNTPNTCVGCHQADYNGTTDPNHSTANFPTDCNACHNENAWQPATWDHDGMYFPIYSGEHEGEWNACVDCHTNPNNYAIFTCITCHTNPDTDEDHEGVNGYIYNSPACLACHPNGDASTAFNHSTTTFPLTGAHVSLDCIDCHSSGFQNTPTDCNACHNTDFMAAADPNHSALNFSTNCVTCHTTDPGWSPASFPNHNDFYPLTGAHIAIANDCVQCHANGYNNTPNTCVGCHQSDYNTSIDPGHLASNFPNDCAMCHTTEPGWSPATFPIHDNFFVINGAHTPLDCNQCHTNGYNNTPTTCVGCHIADYNASVDPDHQASNFPNDCAMCHTTNPGWSPATFPIHNDFFVIDGAHTPLDCNQCHTSGYSNTPGTCVGCHNSDFTTASNPNHVSLGLSNDCITCHTTAPGWNPALFPVHNDFYQISGAHTSLDCADCHNGNYNNTPNTCFGCHANNYNNTNNPNHQQVNFSTNCTTCHDQNAWLPSSWNHNSFYVIEGAHTSLNCNDCHNGNYTTIPNTCVGCHLSDYNNTNNPDHQSANFPTNCATCHSQNAWEPSTWDHDALYFPIYSGRHEDEWNTCSQCHPNANNYAVFTCLTCHQQNQTDDDHDNVSGYQFNSNACLACHPDGED